jgi:hypothetical protein
VLSDLCSSTILQEAHLRSSCLLVTGIDASYHMVCWAVKKVIAQSPFVDSTPSSAQRSSLAEAVAQYQPQ